MAGWRGSVGRGWWSSWWDPLPGSGGKSFGAGRFRHEFEDVAGLAAQRAADRFERREADGAGLAGLENREVGERDVDAAGQLGQRHSSIVEPLVELDVDGHVTPFLRGRRASARLRQTH